MCADSTDSARTFPDLNPPQFDEDGPDPLEIPKLVGVERNFQQWL
jgi:hypothetical protein